MLFDYRSISGNPGARIPIDESFDLSDLEFSGQFPVTEPVRLVGEVVNLAGVITLRAKLITKLHLKCDRCAEPYTMDLERDVSVVFSDDLVGGEDDDKYFAEGQKIDLNEVVVSEFSLSMDTKFLCSEDCKGLCQTCGKKLNDGPCDCDRKNVDPRLSALAKLLDKP